jgi:hypothetical protein
MANGRAQGSSSRHRATQAARWVALAIFVLGGAVMLLHRGSSSSPEVETTITVTDETSRGADDKSATKQTSETVKKTPGPDTSLVGRAFATPGVLLLFRLGILVLVAFLGGAAVQRIWLGNYALTIGPLTLPELPDITKEEALAAVTTVTGSPKVRLILSGPRAPQRIPQFHFIDDPRQAFITIRLEVEAAIRQLAEALNVDKELALPKLLQRLQQRNVIEPAAAQGLAQIIDMGDRAMEGAEVEPATISAVKEEADRVLYALHELARQAREAPAERLP